MSDIVPIPFASVANSFGFRSSEGQAQIGQQYAASIANNVISNVDAILANLSNDGGYSLESALGAIEDLGAFSPSSFTFSYQQPDFTSGTYSIAPSIDLGQNVAEVVYPPTNNFNYPLQDVDIPDIGGIAPTLTSITLPTPPNIQTVGAPPVAPVTTDITVAEAPEISDVGDLVIPVLAAPILKELVIPELTTPDLPSFNLPGIPDLPEVPDLQRSSAQFKPESLPNYARKFDFAAAWDKWLTDLDSVPQMYSPRLTRQEVALATERWAAMGSPLDQAEAEAQTSYMTDMSSLMGAGEYSRVVIARHEAQRAEMRFDMSARAKELRTYFEIDTLGTAKMAYQIDDIYADATFQLATSIISLYNARVTSFALAAQLYEAQLQAELAELNRWKVLVDAEIAKTRLNTQLAQTYAANVQVPAVQVGLYESRVQALLARVDAYKAQMDGFSLKADVARTKVAGYKGSVEGYLGQLTAYGSQFDIYTAQTQAVAAQNRVEAARAQISAANMQAAGANSLGLTAQLEIDAERLKLDARQTAAQFEQTKLSNAIESIRSSIDADLAKLDILQWVSDVKREDSINEAITDDAQNAVRYYTTASDASYRAAEQAFRAIVSSTQAAATAQEAAGRAAASLAQGAYSAVHVSASLSGSGNVSGSEERSDRSQFYFSDMLNYSENREQTLSA